MNDLSDLYRDTIATVDTEGKRVWVYAKKPFGLLYKYRTYVSYFLIALLMVFPFVKIDGNQFILLNFIERKFHIFGLIFWPQDFHLLVGIMIIAVTFLGLFTVVYGRIFCGWICPQTIFLEMIFRKIEYWIEGDRGAQIKLNRQQWNKSKIVKKGSKWFLFALISFLIANVFLAYFIGSDVLLNYIYDGPLKHKKTLFLLLIFTGIFFWVFTWFREQVCIIACPYGRLQGVLTDKQTVNVAYDFKRGEKELGRAKFKKNEDRETTGKGDCIDCHQCVHVCPTGIDIRNGTQLECVNCTACIDACDLIMEKVGYPKGLIRYASEENIEKGENYHLTNRTKVYTSIMGVLLIAFVFLLSMRNDLEATILRLPGQLFQVKDEAISNVFTYKLFNKTTNDLTNLEFKLISHEGEVKVVGIGEIILPKQGLSSGTLFVEIPKVKVKESKEKIKMGIFSNGKLIETTEITFIGPQKYF